MWSNFGGASNEEADDGSRWHRIHERVMRTLSGYDRRLQPLPGSRYVFTYRDRPLFSEPMLGCPCVCEDEFGNVCNKPTVHLTPFCEQCTREQLHLEVKPSTGGEKAGMGLFAVHPRRSRLRRNAQPRATIVFEANDVIVPYYGETLDNKEYNRRYPEDNDICATYGMGLDDEQNFTTDCALVRSPAAYSNDYRGLAPERNAIFVGNGDPHLPILLVAERNIYDGEEIFSDYADDYWSTSGASRSYTTYNDNET